MGIKNVRGQRKIIEVYLSKPINRIEMENGFIRKEILINAD